MVKDVRRGVIEGWTCWYAPRCVRKKQAFGCGIQTQPLMPKGVFQVRRKTLGEWQSKELDIWRPGTAGKRMERQ
jgi:hypothetical protein